MEIISLLIHDFVQIEALKIKKVILFNPRKFFDDLNSLSLSSGCGGAEVNLRAFPSTAVAAGNRVSGFHSRQPIRSALRSITLSQPSRRGSKVKGRQRVRKGMKQGAR